MAQKIYSFDNSTEYTFDPAKIIFDSGKAKQTHQESSPISSNDPFTTAANYSYDSNAIEFTGSAARLKDNWATSVYEWFMSFLTSTWEKVVSAYRTTAPAETVGVISVSGGSLVGGAGASPAYYGYNIPTIIDTGGAANPWGFQIKYVFTEGNNPASERPLWAFQQTSNSALRYLYLSFYRAVPNGKIKLVWLNPDWGGALTIFDYAFNPSINQESEISVVWYSHGTCDVSLYIDGTRVATWAQAYNTLPRLNYSFLRVFGGYEDVRNTHFSIGQMRYFTIRRDWIASQTTIPVVDEAAFPANPFNSSGSSITPSTNLITQGGNGIHDLKNFIQTVTLGSGSEIRYSFSNDDGGTWYFMDGAIPSLSAGFAQTNTIAELVAQLSELSFFAMETNALRFKTWLKSDGSGGCSIDNFFSSHTTYGFLIERAEIITNLPVFGKEISGASAIEIKPTNTTISYQVVLDGVAKWWNGSAWVSPTSLADSNSIETLNTNLPKLLNQENASNVKFKIILYSGDGLLTAEIDSLVVDYLTDTSVPYKTSVNPEPLATDVPLGSTISITFNEAIDPVTAIIANFYLIRLSDMTSVPLIGNPILSNSNKTLTITPANDLDANKAFEVHVTNDIADASGNHFEGLTWTFTSEVIAPAPPTPCVTYGNTIDILGHPVEGMAVSAELVQPGQIPAISLFVPAIKAFSITKANGSFSLPLVPSSNFEVPTQYKITFKYRDWSAIYFVTIPDQSTVDIISLI